MAPYKPNMQSEGTGEGKVALSLWLRSTRRFMENTHADNTQVTIWSIMLHPEGYVYNVPELARDTAAKDILLSNLSAPMVAAIEHLDHAADMWRSLVQVNVSII
jgi:hypothetical protein